MGIYKNKKNKTNNIRVLYVQKVYFEKENALLGTSVH